MSTLINSVNIFQGSNGNLTISSDANAISVTLTRQPSIITTFANAGLVLNGSNGTIVVTTNPPSVLASNVINSSNQSNLINLTVIAGVGNGPDDDYLKTLRDVQANTVQDGYVLTVNTHGTANTADDTYVFSPEKFDGGNF
jgi:hypothetical protein